MGHIPTTIHCGKNLRLNFKKMEIFTELFATLAKLFATVAIIKSLHFLIEINWLVKKGNAFAGDVERAMVSNNPDMLEGLVKENREKTHVLIYKIIRSETKVSRVMGNFYIGCLFFYS